MNERLASLVERHFGSPDAVPDALRAFLAALDGELGRAGEGPELPAGPADEAEEARVRAALAASDEHFRDLAEHVAAATFLYRGNHFVYVNAAATELTGYSREEMLAMDFWDVVAPEHREMVRERGLARQRGEPVNPRYELKIVRKDGGERWLDFTAGGMLYAGRPTMFGTAFDITARKAAEEALQRQALTFENLWDAVILSDLDARVTDWNPAAERIYGWTRAEALGKTAALWIAPEEGDLPRRMRETMDRVGRWEGEVRFVRKDGSRGVSETVIVPLRDAAGVRVGHLGVNRDVTERRRAEEALRASEERFRLMVAGGAQVFFYQHDANGVYEALSPSVRDVLGWSPEELVGETYAFLHTGHAMDAEVDLQTRRTMESGQPNTYIVFSRHKDGGTVALELVETAVRRGGRLRGVQGFARNVTEQIRAQEALRESEERYRSLFEESRDAVYMSTLDGRLLSANQAFLDLFGLTRDELAALRLDEVYFDAADRQRFRDDIFRAGYVREYEVRLRRRGGEEPIHCLLSTTLRRAPDGTVTGFQGIIHDITARKRAEEQLAYGALHDALTHLPNRALFLDRVGQALERVRRGGEKPFALLFLDLDRFKVVNDSLGHAVGDQMLAAVGARLKAALRPGDTVARFGGDEFTLLLDEIATPIEATHVAERVLEALAAPFTLERHEVFTSASVGLAVSTTGAEDPEELLRNADAALSRAKVLGKNRYEVFDRGMHAEAMERLQLETDLRRALERGEFVLRFQPVVRLLTGRIAGFEALIRWMHPERGTVSPAAFIPVVEEMGLIHPLGRWVIEEACRHAKRWSDAFPGRELRVSVNLSAAQFSQADLVEHVARGIEECGLRPGVLHFEITESVILEHAEPALSLLARLRALGVELCMDDFGTGYSSLGYLHRFPIDELKIDRSFVAEMEHDPRNAQLVQAIIGLARNLGVRVVGEGVESAGQLAALRALGCDYAQGFLFAEPLPDGEAEALLAADPRW